LPRSEETRFWLVFTLSVGVSIGWILVAAHSASHQKDGGRGGAIGTAIALSFMFLTRDYGTKLYSAVVRRLPHVREEIEGLATDSDILQAGKGEPSVAGLQTQINALVAALDIDAKGQTIQNYFLAIATCIGTLAWGFGDVAALYLDQHLFR
jgi:hypothetical protein